MFKVGIAVLIMLLVFSFTNSAYARCGMCWAQPAKEGEVVNNVCPVMGGEVSKDTPYKTEYKGKTIGFCCSGCIEKFKADPEKYMAKIQKKCIIKCPSCGAEIDVKQECKKMGYTCQ